MKKTYNFYEEKNKYVIKHKKDVIFEIDKKNLRIDGDKFYKSFFEKFNKGDLISIVDKTNKNANKTSEFVYNDIARIFNDIVEKINSN